MSKNLKDAEYSRRGFGMHYGAAPLSIYIADFYCHKIKLVIELNGGYHDKKEVRIYDATSEKYISDFGIRVIRFKNEEVITDIENVVIKIRNAIAEHQ